MSATGGGDFLGRLASQAIGDTATLQPVMPPLYARPEPVADIAPDTIAPADPLAAPAGGTGVVTEQPAAQAAQPDNPDIPRPQRAAASTPVGDTPRLSHEPAVSTSASASAPGPSLLAAAPEPGATTPAPQHPPTQSLPDTRLNSRPLPHIQPAGLPDTLAADGPPLVQATGTPAPAIIPAITPAIAPAPATAPPAIPPTPAAAPAEDATGKQDRGIGPTAAPQQVTAKRPAATALPTGLLPVNQPPTPDAAQPLPFQPIIPDADMIDAAPGQPAPPSPPMMAPPVSPASAPQARRARSLAANLIATPERIAHAAPEIRPAQRSSATPRIAARGTAPAPLLPRHPPAAPPESPSIPRVQTQPASGQTQLQATLSPMADLEAKIRDHAGQSMPHHSGDVSFNERPRSSHGPGRRGPSGAAQALAFGAAAPGEATTMPVQPPTLSPDTPAPSFKPQPDVLPHGPPVAAPPPPQPVRIEIGRIELTAPPAAAPLAKPTYLSLSDYLNLRTRSSP